jgi:hypothetical protein
MMKSPKKCLRGAVARTPDAIYIFAALQHEMKYRANSGFAQNFVAMQHFSDTAAYFRR